MKKFLFLVSVVFSIQLSQAQNFVRLEDNLAFNITQSNISEIELAIDSLELVLPEGIPDSFKVFDFSYYVYNELMAGLSKPAIWEAQISNASNISKYYILFGREIDKTSGKLNWRVKINLPVGEDFRCSSLEQFESIENYLIANLKNTSFNTKTWAELELQEIKHATIHFNKIFNCCDANRNYCDVYDIISIDYLSSLLLNYEFVELKELTLLVDGTYLGKGGLGHRSGNFFSEQTSFINSLESAGQSASILNKFFQIHTTYKHNEGNPPKITLDNWALYSQIKVFEDELKTMTFQSGFDYKEQNIIIYNDGKYRVFTRISRNINWDFTDIISDPKGSEVRSAVIPVLIGRWVLKKIWQAGVGIAIGFTMDVVIEKYFTYDHDCNWGSAIRYTFQKTEPYKYLLWAVESWLDNSVSASFLGAMSEGASYLFQVSDGSFSFDGLFASMISGGFQGFLINKGVRALGKLFTKLSNELETPLQTIKDDFAILIKEFLIDSGVFRYWKISTFAKRTNWKGFPYIYKASVVEVKAATDKIKAHRKSVGNETLGNYSYLEGQIDGVNLSQIQGYKNMWRSGTALDIEPKIFTAIEVEGSNGKTWLRDTDGEYKMLNWLADKYKNNTSISGEIKIVSENVYCPSCEGVIQQFYIMFPKVKIIIIDGAK